MGFCSLSALWWASAWRLKNPYGYKWIRDERGETVQAISAVTGQGLRALTETMWAAVEVARAEERARMPELIDFGEEEEWLDEEQEDSVDGRLPGSEDEQGGR